MIRGRYNAPRLPNEKVRVEAHSLPTDIPTVFARAGLAVLCVLLKGARFTGPASASCGAEAKPTAAATRVTMIGFVVILSGGLVFRFVRFAGSKLPLHLVRGQDCLFYSRKEIYIPERTVYTVREPFGES